MSLSLSALDSKIESLAASAVEHVRSSVDFKGRLEKLESGAKIDLDAFKAEIMDAFASRLADLRSEIMGEVKSEVSDSVPLVGKAMADLTAAEPDEAPKDDAATPAAAAPSASVVTPAAPVGPVI